MKNCLQYKEDTTYFYQGKKVTVLTIFKDSQKQIALVEDEQGCQYEVPREHLYKI